MSSDKQSIKRHAKLLLLTSLVSHLCLIVVRVHVRHVHKITPCRGVFNTETVHCATSVPSHCSNSLAYQLCHVDGRYLISQHPEVEERILQELAQHQLTLSGDGSIRDIQYEDLARLTYLNCVIKVLHLLQSLQALCCCPLRRPAGFVLSAKCVIGCLSTYQ